MFGSDDRRGASDAKFKAVGVGHYVAFRCAMCNLSKSTTGRQYKWCGKYLGKQLVCKQCAEDA